MNIQDKKLMQELIGKFQNMLPGKEIKPEPATSTKELLEFEKQFKMNTTDLIDRNKDISHIPEEIIEKWELTFRTFKIMKGSMEEINSFPTLDKTINNGYLSKSQSTRTNEYLDNPNKKANPKGFAFLFFINIVDV